MVSGNGAVLGLEAGRIEGTKTAVCWVRAWIASEGIGHDSFHRRIPRSPVGGCRPRRVGGAGLGGLRTRLKPIYTADYRRFIASLSQTNGSPDQRKFAGLQLGVIILQAREQVPIGVEGHLYGTMP